MPRTRPPYPEEFRREAVELVCGGRSIADVAKSLGVSQQTLRTWPRSCSRCVLCLPRSPGGWRRSDSQGSTVANSYMLGGVSVVAMNIREPLTPRELGK